MLGTTLNTAVAVLMLAGLAVYVMMQADVSSDVAAAPVNGTLALTPTTTVTAPTITVPAPTTTVPVALSPPSTTLAPVTVPNTSPRARVTVPTEPPPVLTPAALSVVGLGDPAVNVAPSPDFLASCSGTAYDDSVGCVHAALSALNNARSESGLAAMALPTNWYSLTPAQQLFVVTNLERTVRGLRPLWAMASALDAAAAAGAQANGDAAPPPGFPWTTWGSNWAGRIGNPLEAMYYWMYDDGPGSYNISCTASTPDGCWGHRHKVLLPLPCTSCVMGAAWETSQYGTPSATEILAETQGAPAVDFTWEQEQSYLR
jgi:hypothetical protein